MFKLFTDLQTNIIEALQGFVTNPVNVLTGGIAIFATSILLVWFLYQSYLILIGANNSNPMSFIKDFTIKVLIVIFAGTASYYNTSLGGKDSLLVEINTGLASAFAPDQDKTIFTPIEKRIVSISALLETIEGIPEQNNADLIEKYGEPSFFKYVYKGIAKIDDYITNTSNAIESNTIKLLTFIKLAIIALGLMLFGLFTFISIIVNQFFFYICLAVGPLFIFFAAFNLTKGWFSSWLNVTLGYCFTYPVILLVFSGVMKIFDKLFVISDANSLGWDKVILCFLLCSILGVAISRIGDIASAFFGAGNISDGTIGAAAFLAKSPLKAGGKKAGKAASKGLQGSAQGVAKAIRKLREPKITEGKK